jgi:hypothetical protein
MFENDFWSRGTNLVFVFDVRVVLFGFLGDFVDGRRIGVLAVVGHFFVVDLLVVFVFRGLGGHATVFLATLLLLFRRKMSGGGHATAKQNRHNVSG